MKPNFDMDALRTMVVGTDLGSFARAASHLGRSQSAVSMQLKKLETQAGQPLFLRSGRGLVPTEAGEALLTYARRIIALNDEASVSLGASAEAAAVRMGMPQDFFEDVMPEAIQEHSHRWPNVHVEVRAGRNYGLAEEVRAGRLDVAVGFFEPGSDRHGTLISSLPTLWLGAKRLAKPVSRDPIPLVLFDHPCLFRQSAFRTLEREGIPWRVSLTTPSLPGVWAALRLGHGITVRTAHRVPEGVHDVAAELGLPELPPIVLRMVTGTELSPSAADLRDILERVIRRRVAEPGHPAP